MEMENFELSYREVIPDQSNTGARRDITMNTGAVHSTLQDIKVIEKAGGYCYRDHSQVHNRNRFIYWRTSGDTLELSEVSLDLNLIDNWIRYKFTDAPILSVSIAEHNNKVIVLVATVSSIHTLKFAYPNRFQKNQDETQSFSVFHGACTGQTSRDPTASFFHVINQSTAPNQPIPHTAACMLDDEGLEAYFAVGYQNTVVLMAMNCSNGHVTSTELKENYMVPRILSNFTNALRGKNLDSQLATSLVFGRIDTTVYLYGLYRDDHIRMWSTKTGQCVALVNCGNSLESHGSQNNLLRMASPEMLCAFLSSPIGSEFVTVRIVVESNTYALHRINTIPAPQFDLVEFDVSPSRIWGLWCNSHGEFNVSSYSLVSNGGGFNWSTAGLLELPERKIDEDSDPRQAYCSYIFYPGRFQREVIDRALVMFCRSSTLSDPSASLTTLKDRICYAIEQEVQNELSEYEATEDLYIETSFKAWERFYSCCEQYHVKSTQPIGLVNLNSIGAVAVIKKCAYSLLRPCELLEHLMLVGESDEYIHLNDLTLDDDVSSEDLIKLVVVLSTLEQNISDEFKAEIDMKLYELNTPNELVSQMLSDYEHSFLDQEIWQDINRQMTSTARLPKAMAVLLRMLQMNDGEDEAMQTFPNVMNTSQSLLNAGHLFRSNAGISLVAETLHQIAVVRYALCRNLLILQQILIDTSDLPIDTIEFIRSNCMPETVVFVQAYYVMVWICETYENQPAAGALDSSIQRLSVLQLSDCRFKQRSQRPTTLLEQFLRGKGLQAGLWTLLEENCRDLDDFQWRNTLLPLATTVGQLLWAVDGNFIFGEWLIGSCQHILVQEYVRLLSNWCEWNKYSRHFIAAVSFLDDGEPYKAFDLFMQCAKGVQQEAFLEKVILQSTNAEVTPSEASTQYFLRIIQLYEQYSSQDCVIQLAKAAIDELDPSSPQLAMFQSIVFTNHLNLEHYEEAYHSLIANTEPQRRRDCLRQLVVCLFDKRRLDLLLNFPYLGLQDELENIIESRARSVAIEDNVYYDFLYAFYISRSTKRKAASIMYEQSLRCGLECETLTGIERRYECLLACVTALSLCDEQYRWIARPVISDEIEINPDENDMETDDVTPKQKVIVLELNEIRKEMLLCNAIITLAKYRKELSAIKNANADDMISILSNLRLYTDAVKLANAFEKPVTSILQALAFACVRSSEEESSNESWIWLQENDLADLPQKNSSTEMAWKLLERLLMSNEANGSTVIHKAITNKILGLGSFLPNWLFLSYRRFNPSELLNLFVSHGRLIEACDFAKEYIAAMTASGGEYFGLKNALHATLPALCLPVNTIDSLLHNLSLNSTEDAEYAHCYEDLSKTVDNYLSTAERVSNDKIRYLRDATSAR